ncbi:hypothetical protein Tco_0865697 [Tanacetum coccineum]
MEILSALCKITPTKAMRRTIYHSTGGKLRDKNTEESWALLEDLALYDNESWNYPRDFAIPVKAISLPQDVPSTSDHHLIKLKNQVQRLMEAHHAPNKPVQVNKISSTCEICSSPYDTQYYMENPEHAFVEYASSRINEAGDNYQIKLEKALLGQQQDDMIGKINLLWKAIFEKLDDTPTPDTVGNSMAHKNIASISHVKREKLQSKGIKSLSKLFSLKYLSLTSIEEQNRNLSAPKHVHFVNSIVILNKESEAKEESKEESEEEVSEETEEEEKEEGEEDDEEYFNTFPTMKELGYHEWLLNNPRPSWVKAKIRAENLNNIKISCMIGHFLKKQAYINLEAQINVMSRKHHNSACKCDFMILEDTTSIIDHNLGEVVFGKPFIEETNLVYNKEEGTIAFEKDSEKITFKMPHTMKMFNHTDPKDMNTNSKPPFVFEDDYDRGKTYYFQSLIIGP